MSGRGPQRNRRDANEPEIVQALEAYGFTVRRIDVPVDLLIGRKGRTWIAEIKREGGKLTPAQERFKAAWSGNWIVLRSVEDVAEFAAECENNGGTSLAK